jgi:hypothetical protein
LHSSKAGYLVPGKTGGGAAVAAASGASVPRPGLSLSFQAAAWW